MNWLARILVWVWVALSTPMALYFLLVVWRPGEVTITKPQLRDGVLEGVTTTRPGTWRTVAATKAIAIAFIIMDAYMLAGLLGREMPAIPVGAQRIVVTALYVLFIGLFAWAAGAIARRRRSLQQWARTEQPGSEVGEELLEDVSPASGMGPLGRSSASVMGPPRAPVVGPPRAPVMGQPGVRRFGAVTGEHRRSC